MPKVRNKLNFTAKSGILNSSFKKILNRKNNNSSKYFYINTTPTNKTYTGENYFNDANTYIFSNLEREINTNLNILAVPLTSNPNNFFITSDESLITEGLVRLQDESKLNKNMLLYESNIIDSPNLLNFNNIKSLQKDSSKIFEELPENIVEENYTPYYEKNIEEKYNTTFLHESITSEDGTTYYLGDQKSIEIEIDFTQSEDCHLTNTLFVNRDNNNFNLTIEDIDDSRSFNNQYNFNNKKYSITSSLITNSYWNNTLKRWEYNLNESFVHINSHITNQEIYPPNSLTNSGSTIGSLHNFIDNFIAITPITHSPFYDRHNDLELKKYNYTYNKLTDTYGFPHTEVWNPNKDQLIRMSEYISNEFLLEKVVFEGNISINTEIPNINGNTTITTDIQSFEEEKIINTNDSKYTVSGLNFYLLRSKPNNLKNYIQNFQYLSGARLKRNTDTTKLSDYVSDSTDLFLDYHFSDLNRTFDIEMLAGDFYQQTELFNFDENETYLKYSPIGNSIVSKYYNDYYDDNKTKLFKENYFYYMTNIDRNVIFDVDLKNTNYFCTSEVFQNNQDFYNFNLYDNNNIASLTKYNKFNKIENDENVYDNEIITESSIFYGKHKENRSQILRDEFDNINVIESINNDMSIVIENQNFIAYNNICDTLGKELNSESEFSYISNLYKEKLVDINNQSIKRITYDISLIQHFFNNLGTVSDLRDVDSSLFLGQPESIFQEYSTTLNIVNIPVASTSPDFTLFSKTEMINFSSPKGIRFRFEYNVPANGEIFNRENIFRYDNALNINYINFAIFECDRAINFLKKLDLSRFSERDLKFTQNAQGNYAYDLLSSSDKSTCFVNLMSLAILISLSKNNKLNISKSGVKSVSNTLSQNSDIISTFELFTDENISEYSTDEYKEVIIENDIFNVNIFRYFFGSISPQFTIISSYEGAQYEDIFFNEEIVILEGKNKANNVINNIANRKFNYVPEYLSRDITSRSGKNINYDKNVIKKNNFKYLIKPEDTVILGVSSFSNYNTLASHITLHDKLKITLYGKEIIELKKNESSQSNAIKKVFVGNNVYNSVKDSNLQQKYRKLIVEDESNKVISDTVFPETLSIITDTIGASINTYDYDANDSFYNRYHSVYSNRPGYKFILKDNNISETLLEWFNDPEMLSLSNGIITDWHTRFYFNFDIDYYKNKKFNSPATLTDNITLYYDTDSYAVNNDHFYNDFPYQNYTKYVDSYGFNMPLYSINDILSNSEKLIMTEDDLGNKVLNDISSLGLSYNSIGKINTASNIKIDECQQKFIVEDSNIAVNIENVFPISSGNSFVSFQFLNIPADFYYLDNMNKIDKVNRKEASVIPNYLQQWCIVIDIDNNINTQEAFNYFIEDYKNTKKKFDFYRKIYTTTQAQALASPLPVQYSEYIFNKNKFLDFGENEDIDTYFVNDNTGPRNYIIVFKYIESSLNNIQLIIPFRNKEIYHAAYNELASEKIADYYKFNSRTYFEDNNASSIDTGPLFNSFLSNIIGFDKSDNKFNLLNSTTYLSSLDTLDINDFIDVNTSDFRLLPYSTNTIQNSKSKYIFYNSQDFSLYLKITSFNLKNPSMLDKKDVLFNRNNNEFYYDEFIKDNIITLSDKQYFNNDFEYDDKKYYNYSSRQFYKKIENNIKIYTSSLYKKVYGEKFKKTNIEIIYTVKNNKYNFYLNDGASYSRLDDFITIHGVKYNNAVFDKKYIEENQRIIGLEENDIFRIYHNEYKNISNVSRLKNDYYFEFKLDFNMMYNLTNTYSVKVSPLYEKMSINSGGALVNFGTPISSLDKKNKKYSNLFMLGYRNSRKYKYPVDKFDGYRYGVFYPIEVKKSKYFNSYQSFGQFKDMSYDTQNYAMYYKDGYLVKQDFCIEKNFVDEFYNSISKEEVVDRKIFTGSNIDEAARVYFPYIESEARLTSDDSIDLNISYLYTKSVVL